MNDAAQAKLGEFYLCCALQLRREDIDAAGQDAEKLLKLAHTVAVEEVEPFFASCREFTQDYDESLHQSLNETTIWHEVDDGLFWHHSFEAAAPTKYTAFKLAALPPESTWPSKDDAPGIDAVLKTCSQAISDGGDVQQLAEQLYQSFLEASATPVKASIRSALIDHGIIMGDVKLKSPRPQELQI